MIDNSFSNFNLNQFLHFSHTVEITFLGNGENKRGYSPLRNLMKG